MLILSVGMPRAGSGWHYNLIHDLVVAAGGQDAREVRQRYYLLRKILTEVNCNIGSLSRKRLAPVLAPASAPESSFAIKAHAAPTKFALKQIREGRIHATYVYRDPRAALLSAYEYGRRAFERGRPNAFSHLESVEDAIKFMLGYAEIWEQWVRVREALTVRYEDLLEYYDAEVERLLSFLKIDARFVRIEPVVEKYRPGESSAEDAGLHFHKGQPERFREVLSAAELAAANQAFEPYLDKMGYAL
jgi:hypothetical protein